MNSRKVYFLFVVAFLVVMFIAHLRMPASYNWQPTFLASSNQPFGCMLFDSLMAKSMPKGYKVDDKTFYEFSVDKGFKPHTILVLCEEFNPNDIDMMSAMKLLDKGCNIMIATSSFDYGYNGDDKKMKAFAEKNLMIEVMDYLSPSYFLTYMRNSQNSYNYLTWLKGRYPKAEWGLSTPISSSTIEANYDDSLEICLNSYYSVVVRDEVNYNGVKTRNRYAVHKRCGKGRLIFVSLPLLLTNYGVLDKTMSPLTFRLMSLGDNLPVVRTQAYLDKAQMANGGESPLRYIIKQPPLKWALYLGLLTILLFMIFTARRRQRAIPVVNPPQNYSLEFVKLIGTLYFQKHDNVDLVKKAYGYLKENLRRKLMVDLSVEYELVQNIDTIAAYTGEPPQMVKQWLQELSAIDRLGDADSITDQQLHRYIDIINNISSKI